MANDPVISEEEGLLRLHGINPTANRIMLVRTLRASKGPVSLRDLEDKLVTVDKSVISRSLALFRQSHLVHIVEDGTGGLSYELCMSRSLTEDDDEHVHFHCLRCGRTFCLTGVPVPQVVMPQGFTGKSANLTVRGLCPKCSARPASDSCDE